MARGLIVVMVVVAAIAVGAWALAGPGDARGKTTGPPLERFTVVNAGGAVLLLDTLTGQSWRLAQSATGAEWGWLPTRRVDTLKDATKWLAFQRQMQKQMAEKMRR